MKQSKLDSMLESVTNIVIGSGIAFISQIIWFPLIGIEITLAENAMTTGFFTIVSFVRSYGIRRLFNGRSVYAVLRGRA